MYMCISLIVIISNYLIFLKLKTFIYKNVIFLFFKLFILFHFILLPMQEITLWRKGDVVRKSMSHQAVIASQRFEGSAASESALEQAAKEESG